MWRFFFNEVVLHKKIPDGFGLNAELLLSEPPREGFIAQGRVLDLFHQDRNRLMRCWRPSLCAQRVTALLLCGANGALGTVVDESSLRFLALDLRMIGKGGKERTGIEPQQGTQLTGIKARL